MLLLQVFMVKKRETFLDQPSRGEMRENEQGVRSNMEVVVSFTYCYYSTSRIEVATCYQNVTNLKTCKMCNEGMVEDECHLLFTCLTYSAIHSRYVDVLGGSDNLSAILKTPPRRLSYMSVLFTHRDFVLQCMNTSSMDGDTYQERTYNLVP